MNSTGHKENILDRWHTKVHLGIAYNGYTCSVVQHFEYDYMDFVKMPTIRKGELNVEGRVKSGFVLSGLQVWYHQPPHALTLGQIDATYYAGAGDEPALFILKPAEPGTSYPPYATEPSGYSWKSGVDPYSVSPQAPRSTSSPKGNRRTAPPMETRVKAVPRVIADKWNEKRGKFRIRANIRKAINDAEPGVYIIVIWGRNSGVELPLSNYTIFMN